MIQTERRAGNQAGGAAVCFISTSSNSVYRSMKSPCFPVDVKQAETREVATKVLLLGVNNFAVKHGL